MTRLRRSLRQSRPDFLNKEQVEGLLYIRFAKVSADGDRYH
jgi:hypothetical protein